MEWLLLIYINASFSNSVMFKDKTDCENAKSKIEAMSSYGVNKPVFTAVCLEGGKESK